VLKILTVLYNKPVEEKEEHTEKGVPRVAKPGEPLEKHADIENNLENNLENNILIIYNANS
jgi:hypothetical protein